MPRAISLLTAAEGTSLWIARIEVAAFGRVTPRVAVHGRVRESVRACAACVCMWIKVLCLGGRVRVPENVFTWGVWSHADTKRGGPVVC